MRKHILDLLCLESPRYMDIELYLLDSLIHGLGYIVTTMNLIIGFGLSALLFVDGEGTGSKSTMENFI